MKSEHDEGDRGLSPGSTGGLVDRPDASAGNADLEAPGSVAAVESLRQTDPVLAASIEAELAPHAGAQARVEDGRPGGGPGSLGADMKRGAVWSSMSSVALRLGTFAMGIIAARLIAPEQFGVFTVALTVHAIIVNVSEIGVGAYLVRHTGNPDKVAPTVLTISLATSATLAAGMFLAAPALASSLGSAAAAGPIRVLSITVLLAGPTAVPNALLVRSFRQDKIFWTQILSFFTSNSVMVAMAMAGFGAYALAWSRVAGLAAQAIALIILAGRIYRPGFDRVLFPKLLRFGLPLAGFSLVGFATGNIDFVIVGRMLGAEQLGLYSLAYNISSWGYGFISPVVAAVAMPAFARVRHDAERMPRFMETALQAVLCLALPIAAMTIALADPLIGSVYGSKWIGAAPALAVTALYGALRVPSDLFISSGIAMGRTKLLFVTQIVYFAVLLPVTVIGVERLGIVGAGWAHVVGISMTLLPGLLWMVRRDAGASPLALLRASLPPLLASALAGAVAYGVSQRLDGSWAQLLLGGLAGLATFVGVLGPWLRRVIPDARSLWQSGSAQSGYAANPLSPAVPGD